MQYINVLTPIGFLTIFSREDRITSIQFNKHKQSNLPDKNELLIEAEKQLLAYFGGKLQQFDLPLNPIGTDFQLSVWQALMEIPFAKTITYLEFAIQLGNVKTIRAAAAANGKNPIPILIPCHRVIGSNNKLIGYSGGLDKKHFLLQHEKTTLGIGQTELF